MNFPIPQSTLQYFDNGKLTPDGMEYFQQLLEDLQEIDARLTAGGH